MLLVPAPDPAVIAALQNRPATNVQEVVIQGEPPTWRVWVEVGGDLDRNTVVISRPVGVLCGAFAYRYEDGTRQCWLRQRSGTPVMFTARAGGRIGQDWTVVWTGCVPSADGASCALTTPRSDVEVGAVFHRMPG